jgi:hypothetical protein
MADGDTGGTPSERLAILALCAALTGALMLSHAAMDSKVFGFLGLRYQDPGWAWTLLSLVFGTLPGLWLPAGLRRPSEVAYWILYATVIAPTSFLPYRVLDMDFEAVTWFVGAMVACFYALGFACRMPLPRVPRPDWDTRTYAFVLLAVLLGATLAVWYLGGFRLDLGLTDIYARRRAAREIIAQQSLASYLKGNLASALQPFALAIGLSARSLWLIAASVFAGVVVFSLEGSKTSALVPLFLLALWPFLTHQRRRFGVWFLGACLFLVGAAYLAFEATRYFHIPTLSTWRLFQVKGLLSSYYFEYFTTHPPTLLGDGILQPLVGRTYELATPRLIGEAYFGSDETNSNANLWASGFGDFGFLGMALATVAAGAVFRLLDGMATARGFLIPAFMAAFIGLKWSDTAVDTSILSHGVLATLLLLYLMPDLRRPARPSAVHPPAAAPA